MNETDSKGDALDSEVLATPVDSEKSTKTESVPTENSSTEQVPKVTSGFFSAPTPVDLETVNEN